MWSASSRTVISTWSRLARAGGRSGRSSRPGVATTMSTPRRSAVDLPADRRHRRTTVVTRRPSRGRAAPARRRPAGPAPGWAPGPGRAARAAPAPAGRLASRASIGRPKARVLPEPVCARPSTSRPASASGRARAWMANGCGRCPARASAVTSGPGSPSSAKVAAAGAGALSAAVSARSSSDTTGAGRRRPLRAALVRRPARAGRPAGSVRPPPPMTGDGPDPGAAERWGTVNSIHDSGAAPRDQRHDSDEPGQLNRAGSTQGSPGSGLLTDATTRATRPRKRRHR